MTGKPAEQSIEALTINRLRQLSAEAETLADQLAAQQGTTPDLDDTKWSISECVRDYLRRRHRRQSVFPASTFSDPAWDIILDLFASELEGRHVSVSDACVILGAPPTTALRWIKLLESDGHICRLPSVNDGRRVHLSLTSDCRRSVEEWVSATFGTSTNPLPQYSLSYILEI